LYYLSMDYWVCVRLICVRKYKSVASVERYEGETCVEGMKRKTGRQEISKVKSVSNSFIIKPIFCVHEISPLGTSSLKRYARCRFLHHKTAFVCANLTNLMFSMRNNFNFFCFGNNTYLHTSHWPVQNGKPTC
jgi:hypothetical protein